MRREKLFQEKKTESKQNTSKKHTNYCPHTTDRQKRTSTTNDNENKSTQRKRCKIPRYIEHLPQTPKLPCQLQCAIFIETASQSTNCNQYNTQWMPGWNTRKTKWKEDLSEGKARLEEEELYMSNNGYFTTEHCFKRDTQIDLKIN